MISRISVLLFVSLSGFLINPLQIQASGFPADSIRVKNVNGNKFILHKVEPRETWSHLAKRYNCTVEELLAANNGVEIIKIDQIVNIPLSSVTAVKSSSGGNAVQETVKTSPPVQKNPTGRTPVVHTVKQGETLFAIARKYDQPVNTIKDYNKLVADNIIPGQKLIVNYVGNTGNQVIAQTETQKVVVPPAAPKSGAATADKSATPLIKSESPEAEPAKEAAKEIAMSADANAKMEQKFFDKPTKSVTTVKKGSSSKSMVQVTETGVATWIQDGNQSGNKYFGLHRTAPIGTIVKVTNRMNNLSVYVKIVGVLPDTGDNDNVIIKMSQAVSEKLNALDTFFQVELSYGLME